jgi:hypothetical protein
MFPRAHVSQELIRAIMPASRHAWQRLDLIMASMEESMTARVVACLCRTKKNSLRACKSDVELYAGD